MPIIPNTIIHIAYLYAKRQMHTTDQEKYTKTQLDRIVGLFVTYAHKSFVIIG